VEQYYFKSYSRIGCASRIRKVFTHAIVVALVLVLPASASADGIDIVWLITRVGGPRLHPALEVAIVVGLLIVNYLLNVVVLGIPASRFLQIKLRALRKDLAAFTLLAQVADRASAVGGFLLGSSIIEYTGPRGEQEVVAGLFAGVCLNFIFAGLAVGLLALWYLIRRWGVKRRRAIAIAVLTAVITNPAWVMMIQFIRLLKLLTF
jgi:hypothetical protein